MLNNSTIEPTYSILSAMVANELDSHREGMLTHASLMNAVELGAGVVKNILGNEASTMVAGESIEPLIRTTIATKLKSRLQVESIVGVSPAIGSALEELTSRSLPTQQYYAPGEVDKPVMDAGSAIQSASAVKNLAGEDEHGILLSDTVGAAAAAVTAQLRLARSEVNPVIADLVKDLEKEVQDKEEVHRRLVLTEYELIEPLRHPSFLQMLQGHNTSVGQGKSGTDIMFPSISADELMGFFKTGVASLDEVLVKEVEGSDLVADVYNNYFRKQMVNMGNVEEGLIETILYVLARSFATRAPEGVPATASDLRMSMTEMTHFYAQQLNNLVRRYENQVRLNRLVISSPSRPEATGGSVKVNKAVYQKFLQKGGDIDAVIGAVLRGIKQPLFEDLLEDAHGGVRAVQANERTRQASILAARESAVGSVARRLVSDYIKDAVDEVERPMVQKALRSYLEENPYRQAQDAGCWLRKVICDVIFPNYKALPVLEAIEYHMKNDPNLTAREAATFVVFDEVADWLKRQLTVEYARK